jgi:hypothetical protein
MILATSFYAVYQNLKLPIFCIITYYSGSNWLNTRHLQFINENQMIFLKKFFQYFMGQESFQSQVGKVGGLSDSKNFIT